MVGRIYKKGLLVVSTHSIQKLWALGFQKCFSHFKLIRDIGAPGACPV